MSCPSACDHARRCTGVPRYAAALELVKMLSQGDGLRDLPAIIDRVTEMTDDEIDAELMTFADCAPDGHYNPPHVRRTS